MPQGTQPAVTAVPWAVVPSPDRPSVRISKAAADGTTQFVGGCDRQAGPGLQGRFVNYAGADLQAMDGQIERVLIEVRGAEWKEAFAAELRYNARSRSWELAKPLPPVFVGSFSRGAKLAVRNSQWQEVFTFDLTGSSNAAQTMRSACGF